MSFINFSRANCKNCYKCVRSCPVKAIRIKNDQAEVVEDRCIGCGKCMVICPQNARNIKSDLEQVKIAIKGGKNLIASVAPSFVAGCNKGQQKRIITALKILGFSVVEETAVGAKIVSKLYGEFIENNSVDNLITTCCPSANYLIENYFPSLIKYMIPIVSPMIAHGKLLKDTYGEESFVVFIGPCYSKKLESLEAINSEVIDSVLNFEDIIEWFKEENLDLNSLNETEFDNRALGICGAYPIGGGVMDSVSVLKNNPILEKITVSGMKECIEIFKCMENGEIKNACVEASACKGSCVGGPAMIKSDKSLYTRKKQVEDYIKGRTEKLSEVSNELKDLNFTRSFTSKFKYKVKASAEEITKIFHDMGKYEIEDELNCGVCGYDTCLEKAQAIFEGMAETNMCLHYMRNKAESLTNIIFGNSPNLLIILDEDLKIKEINPVAEEIFMVKAKDVRDKPISILIEDSDFKKVKDSKINIIDKKVVYPEYNIILNENILYLEKQNIILAIMNNIMVEEKNKKEFARVKENTLNAAQEVIEKQMRVAQEIASLLGETTAETKIILTKLKKIVLGEDGEIR